MTRSRRKQSSILDDLFKFLKGTPSWVGPVLAVLTFGILRWVMPILLAISNRDNAALQTTISTLSDISVRVSPWFGLAILLVWIAAEVYKRKERAVLNSQSGIESIRELHWREFETLLVEAYRRQGYRVEHTGRPAPDGGVDLRITMNGKLTLVQCKHWKARKVSVRVVRELLGVVASEQADSGIVVTSGEFTLDAAIFAQGNPITLVDGPKLEQLIREVQSPAPNRIGTVPSSSKLQAAIPCCPKCNSPMALRTSQRGPKIGSQFWGCSRFPECRGTQSLTG